MVVEVVELLVDVLVEVLVLVVVEAADVVGATVVEVLAAVSVTSLESSLESLHAAPTTASAAMATDSNRTGRRWGVMARSLPAHASLI